ncbi:FecR domain-containing protein [Ideonella sp. DXS22W]|uniref:FecR domain-containing protein n=1 Tax=Pseudaquabacterium inlustre TaxID=2984192 RepID=A0ABU9CA53_9BURK
MSARLASLAVIASLCLAMPAWSAAAEGPAGIVKRSAGAVTLLRGGAAPGQALAVGHAVQVGDVVRTGADGRVGITLADDTLLAAGPNSELVLSEFAFNATTQDGGLLVSIWRGTLAMVTGLLARKAPEKVNVQTRNVVLGVRGTEFIVDAGEGAK